MKNRGENVVQTPSPVATRTRPFSQARPGEFPLHSNQSRAAARAVLEQRQQTHERLEFIIGYNAWDLKDPRATAWEESADGRQIVRIVSIPEGMTVANALAALGGCTSRELGIIAERQAEPVVAGFLGELRR
jgi:hypothetical protein